MKMYLHNNWVFAANGDTAFMPATVPGCVHTDLLANGILKDPFDGLNEREQQWVDKKDWIYKTQFALESKWLRKDRVELICEGLDTHADVYVNGHKAIWCDNMFRLHRENIKPFLKPGEGEVNELLVYFKSPVNEALPKHDSLYYKIPLTENDQSQLGGLGDKQVGIFVRKAGYHFGWDWGPRFVTSGIWRPIALEGWNKATLREVYYHTDSIQSDFAFLKAQLVLEAVEECTVHLDIKVNGISNRHVSMELKPGLNPLSLPLEIANPRLWNPRGRGDAYLYDMSVSLRHGNEILDADTRSMGLRTVELVQEEDSVGRSFYFRINGKPLFAKGVNYIPQDVFLNRVTEEQYEEIVQNMVAANMNMVRVWGGGVYEQELFYDLCDKNGILVWQDFMFACAMYPGHPDFLENIRHEAADQVRRLRQHPSLVLWCGNNESLHFWKWWQQALFWKSGDQAVKEVQAAYDSIFLQILPQEVAKYQPGMPYHSSSPSTTTQGKYSSLTEGDVHYWDVWWALKPIEEYEPNTGRFMSEFGFQSFPDLSTLKTFAQPQDMHLESEVMLAHQRATDGNMKLSKYVDMYFRKPRDFAAFVYTTQCMQADAIQFGIETHRRYKSRCMGSLYWQINDCWPVASWSSIDYYGNWKGLHYTVKRAFEDVRIIPVLRDRDAEIHLVNDHLTPLKGQYKLELLDFKGQMLWQETKAADIPANSSVKLNEYPIRPWFKDHKPGQLFLHCTWQDEQDNTSENILYFAPPKEQELPVANIQMDTQTLPSGDIEITLYASVLARRCRVYTHPEPNPHPLGRFSDNFFDLLPGQTRRIVFTPAKPIPGLSFSCKSLVEQYE